MNALSNYDKHTHLNMYVLIMIARKYINLRSFLEKFPNSTYYQLVDVCMHIPKYFGNTQAVTPRTFLSQKLFFVSKGLKNISLLRFSLKYV